MTLPLTLPADDPWRQTPGKIVPIQVAGQLRVALRAQPDSDMAAAGKDLMLTFCSDQCATAMREAIKEERAALLS